MKRFSVSTAMPIVMLFCLLHLLAGTARAGDATYSLNMVGPNDTASASGSIFRITGGGSFDPTAGTIVATGSFIEFNADGSVAAQGRWVATTLVSFDAFGGPNPGEQGGVLKVKLTLSVPGAGQQQDVPLTFVCGINAPPGFIEGVTLEDFTQVKRGNLFFHLNN